MNVDEALRQMADGEELPRAALQWALDHWEDTSPHFLSRLRAFAAAGDNSGAAGDEVFYILHLCGEKGETRAYAPLCGVIARDTDIDDWLGDAVTGTLPGILIKTFDGDIGPLQSAIESPYGDEFARASALSALGYLVRARGVMSDADMRAYLRHIRRDVEPRCDSIIWMTWAATAANLGFSDLRLDVALLNKDEFIAKGEFDPDRFDRQIELARSDPTGLAGFERDWVSPLNDAIATLESWSSRGDGEFEPGEDFEPEDMAQNDWEPEDIARADAPHVNLTGESGATTHARAAAARNSRSAALRRERRRFSFGETRTFRCAPNCVKASRERITAKVPANETSTPSARSNKPSAARISCACLSPSRGPVRAGRCPKKLRPPR